MRSNPFYISVFLIHFMFLLQALTTAQYNIPFSVTSGGGEKLSASGYTLNGTVGESFTGPGSTFLHRHYTGFWSIYLLNIISSSEDKETEVPAVYKLEQNYPNPFNPSTTVRFGVPERSIVLIKIYDILGSELGTLVREELDAGWYDRTFDASGYSSGIYICRMQAGKYVSTKKMILIK